MLAWLDEEAEYRWLERHSYNYLFRDFVREIAIATCLIQLGNDKAHVYTVNKIVYVHAVTLLETFIVMTVRTLVVSPPQFMANMVANIDALNEKQKCTLKQIAQHPKGVSEVILGIDSDTFLTLAPTLC